MVWVDAPPIAAEVIDVESRRDRALKALVGDAVRVARLSLHPDASVARVAQCSLPAPAKEPTIDLLVEPGIKLASHLNLVSGAEVFDPNARAHDVKGITGLVMKCPDPPP